MRLPIFCWRVEWPTDIGESVISLANPSGTITNSDLEMATVLFLFLVLEHLVSLKHVHVAAWCDTMPTVSWTNKLSSSCPMVAGRLTCALLPSASMPMTLHRSFPFLLQAFRIKWWTLPPARSVVLPQHLKHSNSLMTTSYTPLLTQFPCRTTRGVSSE